MKILFTTSVMIAILVFGTRAQTNVSGGIYANATWTLTNSPYIVMDTVVVFPGVTLTIEPGVTVKFQPNQSLQIRQGTLIASGTITNPITFTSNSSSPTPGIWGGVYLTNSLVTILDYCNFYYATYGLNCNNVLPLIVQHCQVMHNVNGIYANSLVYVDSCDIEFNTMQAVSYVHELTNCTISHNEKGTYICRILSNCVVDSNTLIGIDSPDSVSYSVVRHNLMGIDHPSGAVNNCTITNNQYGIHSPELNVPIRNCIITSDSIGIQMHYNTGTQGHNSIDSCQIEYNKIGIDDAMLSGDNTFTKNIIDHNEIGILLYTSRDTFYCNRICNNTLYDLKYLSGNPTNSVANNNWCTSDSVLIESLIYDGYDNVSSGLVSFMPLDNVQCYLTTDISVFEARPTTFSIYPIPATDYLTLELPDNSINTEIKIINLLGELKYFFHTSNRKSNIDISNLTNGIYIMEVSSNINKCRQKFVKQ